jgi:ATP-dependent exoDNAse (exonuclease V) alpha subunit
MHSLVLPKKIDLNPLFKRALHLMEGSEKHIFVTGRAGTGKSTLLDYFRSVTEKEIVVLAPTGVAAVNVGGETIHSFFRFKPDVTVEQIRKDAGKRRRKDAIYENLDAIVIDEISMVRADLLDCVDAFLRRNGKASRAPFGGIQMILIGDLYQLPPVVVGKEREVFRNHYKSEYFFDSKVFKDMKIEYLELEKVYRQTDKAFIRLLNGIRNKTIDDAQIEEINRCYSDDEKKLPGDAVYLTTTNRMAEERNEAKLSAIKGKQFTFEASVRGKFEEKYFPTERLLTLKRGAQVMLLNNDAEGRWINGSIGTVHKIKEDHLSVRLAGGGIEEITPFNWSIYRFFWDEKSRSVDSEVAGSFAQYPVKLAWAITIHKSQGKTFENAVIDFGRGTFSPGQAYVALSRCRSLDGLFLKRKIRKSDIWRDWRVVKFVTSHQYEVSERQMPIAEKIGMIEKAIEDGFALEITYLKSGDEKSRRLIQPRSVSEMEYMGKTFMGLIAYCGSRREERTFRVDRILEMRLRDS